MKWTEVAVIGLAFAYNLSMFAGAAVLVWHGVTAWVFLVPLLVAITRIKSKEDP